MSCNIMSHLGLPKDPAGSQLAATYGIIQSAGLLFCFIFIQGWQYCVVQQGTAEPVVRIKTLVDEANSAAAYIARSSPAHIPP